MTILFFTREMEKIRRPSKITTTGNTNKIKRMPSPRKVTTGSTTSTNFQSKEVGSNSSTKPDNRNSKNNSTTKKSGMEEFFEKVRRKSNLVAPNVSFEDSDDDEAFEDFIHDDRKRRVDNKRSTQQSSHELTTEDIEICQRLDDEYERALEERDIGYNARYSSVRQTAMWSVFFLVAYMAQGTYCYRELLLLNNNKNKQKFGEGEDEFDQEFSNWSIPESLFFSIFTITTVGYGREDLPTTESFQAYTIFYILVGIAALTIMVAQVYQCIALEASRARLSQDRTELKRRSGLMLSSHGSAPMTGQPLTVSSPNSSQHSSNTSCGGRRSENVANDPDSSSIIMSDVETGFIPKLLGGFFRVSDNAKHFFANTEIGKSISVVFPFAGLILSGALVVGPLEGWTFLESLYFSVVSLTTVGYGDYVPTKLASIWFCIFWLPFSIGFMSMYLGNIATFYIRLSDRNIRRIERRLRRRLQKAKEKADEERAEVLRRAYRGQEAEIEIVVGSEVTTDQERLNRTVQKQRFRNRPGNSSGEDDSASGIGIPMNHARSVMRRKKAQEGFNMVPTSDLGTDSDDESDLFDSASDAQEDTGYRRRQRIIENCRVTPSDSNGDNDGDAIQTSTQPNDRTMKSMKDVIRAVRNTLKAENAGANVSSGDANSSKFMSIQSTQYMINYSMFRRRKTAKPSFGLRVLVQERFAEIIAIEVAGYHSSIEIKDHTLSVTIESLSQTADKWSIPRRARKAFRAVAFEILYFVGEHGLIVRGADALYELTPFEFHGLFSSLVAAMGDANTMEGWLEKTDALALVDLHRGSVLKPAVPEVTTDVRPRQGLLS